MDILETIAMIFTLACVYLTSKQNIWCWATGIVGIIAFFVLFLNEKIYFQATLQVVFLFQSLYGWHLWKKTLGKGKFIVKKQKEETLISHITLILAIGAPLGYFMGVYTDSTLPILDGITTGMAILATYYLGKQYIEAWIVWMGFNVLLCSMMLHQELYILSLLEVILFFISLNAYITWRKDLKTDYA